MHLFIFIDIDDVLWLVISNLLLIKILNCTNTDSPPSQYFNKTLQFVQDFKDSTHKGAKDHATLCISSKVKGFNGHHKMHEEFYGIHIHRLHINKEEGSTIYSSYKGYQGPQHHQSSGNKDFFKNITIIFKVSISLKTYPMVPLYIFITIIVPNKYKHNKKHKY